MSKRVLGCDVSVWQDDNSTPQRIDFERMKGEGAKFVFIKASQGTWADPDFIWNWDAAKRAGMYRGAYHYLDWRYDVIAQADFFTGLLLRDPGELPPVLDYEMRSYIPSRSLALARAWSFISRVEKNLGRKLIIYTSPGFWAEFGEDKPYWKERELWIAHYGIQQPKIPKPWEGWTFWQFTDRGPGRQFGVESQQIDLNYFNGNWDQFVAKFGNLGEPNEILPEPSPTPKPAGVEYEVLVDGLRVRERPEVGARVVDTLRKGAVVEALEEKSNDLWIRHRSGWSAVRIGDREYMRKL